MTTKARQLAELIANSLVDSDEISTGAVTTSKLADTLDFSSKTMVMADNQLSGDKIHGGTVSAFASTGIDDNASATAVTIASNGNIGIGTTSPLSTMHLSTTGGGSVYFQDSNATSTYNISEISNNAGNFGIQTRNSSGTFVSTDYQIVKNASGADYHRWFTQGTERMRIDASGNLLVGKTGINFNTDGTEIKAGGELYVTQTNAHPLQLNRLSSDGDIAKFYKDGTSVGNISVTGTNDIAIYTTTANHTGLRLGEGYYIPINNTGATADNAVDLGLASIRYKDLYLSGSIANPSGNLTLDASNEIHLDADSGIIRIRDAGGDIGMLRNESNDFTIRSMVGDADLLFKGNDNGSVITALTLDMSGGGFATFNKGIELGGNIVRNADLGIDVSGDITLDADGGQIFLKDGGTQWLELGNGGSGPLFISSVQDKDIIFQGNDGGSTITALSLDMSNGGQAVFNKGASFQDHVYLQDNDKLVLGNSDDLQIYHNGSDSVIHDAGTGNLKILANNFNLLNATATENYMSADNNGAVILYHDNSNKLATTSTGIAVTGSTAHTAGDITNTISGTYNLNGANGTAGSPAYATYSFKDDPNTGMYRAGTDTLAFTTAGSERLRINSSGRQSYNGTAYAIAHGNFVGEVASSGYRALSFEHTVGGGEVGSIRTTSSTAVYYGDGSQLTGVGGSTAFGAVGTYIWGRPADRTEYATNATASSLYAVNNKVSSFGGVAYWDSGWQGSTAQTAVSGTWRHMGGAGTGVGKGQPGIWVRIS